MLVDRGEAGKRKGREREKRTEGSRKITEMADFNFSNFTFSKLLLKARFTSQNIMAQNVSKETHFIIVGLMEALTLL